MLRRYPRFQRERLLCTEAIATPIHFGEGGQGGRGLTGTEFFSPRMLSGRNLGICVT
jgi:hypothetical protein